MTKYEKEMLNNINDKIAYLMEEKGYSAYDISVLLDDFIYDNDFSNECNQELWAIQEIYIQLCIENEKMEG